MTEQAFLIRNYDGEADLPRLLHLLNLVELEMNDPQPTTEGSLRAQLQWPGHDPARDRWVAAPAEMPDVFAGHASLFPQSAERGAASITVHPAWRGQGLGSALLGRVVARAREQGAGHLTLSAAAEDGMAASFITRHGFRPAGHIWWLTAPEDTPLPEPVWPAGYHARPYAEIQDLDVLARALNASFGDIWGHKENTPGAVTAASLASQMRRQPQGLPPEGMFVAFGPEGDPAGFCRGEAGQPAEPGGPVLKLVDGPGVAAAHRSQRLQRPLVLSVMRWLRQQGPGAYDLQSWGDTPETVELYREIGFDVAGHWMEYRLDLR